VIQLAKHIPLDFKFVARSQLTQWQKEMPQRSKR